MTALLLGGAVAWWAGRDRPAQADHAVYVALGASDAVGTGAERPSDEGWVPLVHAGLPSGTELVNLGINGATLDDVLRLELPVALGARPRWVTIWPGVNDLRHGVPRETFADQLDTLLGALNTAGVDQVVVLNVPDLRPLPAFSGVDPVRLDATVARWNAVIAEAAARHGALLVDLRTNAPELVHHPEYVSGDGFHPSSLGYRRIADLTLEAIHHHAATTADPQG